MIIMFFAALCSEENWVPVDVPAVQKGHSLKSLTEAILIIYE